MKKLIRYLFCLVLLACFILQGCDFDQTESSIENKDSITEETLKNITVPTSGLVGRWEMDSLIPIANVTPGTPSYGRVRGASRSYGWDGNSFYFDGGDSIDVADNANIDFGTGDFSIFCLIKPTSVSSIKTILDKRDTSTGYHLTVYNGKLLLQIDDGTSWKNFVSTSTVKTISANRWHSILVTVDRNNTSGVNMYIDGYRVGTFDPTAIYRSISNSATLYIGKHKDTSSYNFSGRIDKVLLYNKVLSSSEQINLTVPGLPPYAPSVWNQSGTIGDNNCYNYASNIINNQFAQPGYASGIDLSFIHSSSLSVSDKINRLHNAVIADGLEPVNDDWWSMYLKKGVVALVFANMNIWNPYTGTYRSDFHFYRLNNDLVTWSHKRGDGPVLIHDESDDLIFDPETADRGKYTYFVGYYKLWSDSEQGKGHEYLRGPR